MQALLRLFGVSNEQRRIRKRDFHVPIIGSSSDEKRLVIEVLLAFPELEDGRDESSNAVPEFYRQMTINEAGNLKCRIRLEATWIDDGTAEGAIEQEYFVITALDEEFDEVTQKQRLAQADRGRIQVIYVPAVRDGESQVTNALKNRLWKAISWSEDLKTAYSEIGEELEATFQEETAVECIVEKVNARWQEVHNAGTDSEVFFSPMEGDFDCFVRKVSVGFRPSEDGDDRNFDELSDGQRSLFHIALTTALLDVEGEALENRGVGFHPDLYVPALTLIAIEEPENNLAPFYLSRIIRQIESLAGNDRCQAVLSTHSASTLSRIKPESIRYFRCDTESRLVSIRSLTLPKNNSEAGKYVREAVRAYPELYFAKFVVLGEGDSELIVLPRLAEAINLSIDPSFVSIVPLGGRHVNHFWRLLNDLKIPFATLLDLDLGRQSGGWGRIGYVCNQLKEYGRIDEENYTTSLTLPATGGSLSDSSLQSWISFLRSHNVFFSAPLDIDLVMLNTFWDTYTTPPLGARGPSGAALKAKEAVLKENGDLTAYSEEDNESFLWYRYLFLGRGKPSTHIAALAELDNATLQADMPEPLRALLRLVHASVTLESDCDNDA